MTSDDEEILAEELVVEIRALPTSGKIEALTKVLRRTRAEALFEANAIYLLHEVPPAHVAAIEVRNRAMDARKRAA